MERATFVIFVILCAASLALVQSCAADPDEDGGGDADTDIDTDTDSDSDSDTDSDTDEECVEEQCTTPPEDWCLDSTTLWEYHHQGECVSGDCWYDSDEIPCATECVVVPDGDDYCEQDTDSGTDTDTGTDTST